MAYRRYWPDAGSGSEMPARSHRVTSRILAAIARNNSRSSRFEVMRLVRFSNNSSRLFWRCNSACED